MNLYIPEIGDHIILTKDWTFNLFPEYRNADLGAFFGHYLAFHDKWVDDDTVLPPMREVDYNDPKYYFSRKKR